MTNIKDRLLRREAKRILGERTASVVGEIRDELLKTQKVVTELDDTLTEQVNLGGERHKRLAAVTGRLDALEFWQQSLRESFWTRLKFLWSGSVLP